MQIKKFLHFLISLKSMYFFFKEVFSEITDNIICAWQYATTR